MNRAVGAVAVTAAAVAAAVSCSPHPFHLRGTGEAAVMGIYRGAVEENGKRGRRFRLLLYIAPPDRFHAEVLSPVGGPELIVDGGGERIAVSIVDERTAFVGKAEPEALERVLGVRVGLEEWVGALAGLRRPPAGVEIDRGDAGPGALPREVSVRGRDRTLRLVWRTTEAVAANPATLGTGAPAPGLRIRPLDELSARLLPWSGGD